MRSALFCALLPCLLLSASAPADEKRELLSEHHTVAVFDGVEFRLCRGRTALCPENCGHSGNFAFFTVKKYVKYEKHGEYGDPQQKSFVVQVSDFDKMPFGNPEISKTIAGLKKGDLVHLSWNHDYVTKNGTSSPERPIVKLEKMKQEQGEEIKEAQGD